MGRDGGALQSAWLVGMSGVWIKELCRVHAWEEHLGDGLRSSAEYMAGRNVWGGGLRSSTECMAGKNVWGMD